MIEKILNKVRMLTIPICFVIFVVLNSIFCALYCGEVTASSWLFSLFWALFFCGIFTMLPTMARRIGIVLLITVFALSCILHAVMYNLFGSFFSFADLMYTEDGLAFFSFSYLKARKLLWLTVVGCILMSVFLAWNLKKEIYSIKKAVIGSILIVLSVLGIYSQHKKLMADVNTSISFNGVIETEGDIYQSMTNKNYAMSITGIYQYLYRNFMVSSGLENQLNNSKIYKELDQYYSMRAQNEHVPNEMSGIFEGNNVFFIMLESIDTWMLTEDYMPNLYAVQQESINFVNHYTPSYISAGTFNTEFIANTSLIPPTTGINPKVYSENYFPYSIGNCFANIGYSVNSFHGSNPHMYNRGVIHENLGYKKYHNWTAMNMNNHMLDSQMINGYSKMVSNEPFFSFVITYSGHGPYTDELHEISDAHIDLARDLVAQKQIEATKTDLEEYTHAIAHAMETDAFVGGLMKQLETDGLLNNTVLVFFTDHYGKYMTNHEFIMELKGVDNKDFLTNTPFFIYQSETSAQTVETISSTMDIVPTVANLFGLDVEYAYYSGVDIFSEEEHYVIFPGNNWYDGEIYYTLDYEGELTEKILDRCRKVTERIRYSEYTLRSNYFSYLDTN